MKKVIFRTISITLVITHLFTVCLRDVSFAAEGGTSQPQIAAGEASLQTSTSADTSDTPVDASAVSDKSPGKDKQKDPKLNDNEPGQITASALAATGSSSGASDFNIASLKSFQNDPFTGRASFSVPIAVPPGRRGLQPALALSYTSTSGNSIAGMGWGLELGSIERSTKKGIPKYTSADTFVFNSGGAVADLVNIGGTEYRAKIEGGFMKISFDGTSWKVIDKSGMQYFFGSTLASRQEKSPTQTYAWRLDKVKDVFGNYMLVSYVKDQNQIYPLKVEYTGNEIKGDLLKYKVEFTLEARPDINFSYRSGMKVTTAKRLKEVVISYNSSLVRKYLLAYQASASGNRSLLNTVTQVGNDGITSLPPIQFSYQEKRAQVNSASQWNGVLDESQGAKWVSLRASVSTTSLSTSYVETIDMNGDGLLDRVFKPYSPPYTYWRVQLNNGNGFNAPINWNGVDYCGYANEKGISIRAVDLSGVEQHTLVDIFDINGDGLPDRVLRPYGTPMDHWEVQLNNGSGFNAPITWPGISYCGYTDGKGVAVRYVYSASGEQHTQVDIFDINGDGLPDRVLRPYGAPMDHWEVQLNNGSGFNAPTTWNGLSYCGYGDGRGVAVRCVYIDDGIVDIFDINGDGLPDRLLRSPTSPYDHWEVQLNNGVGFDVPTVWAGVADEGHGTKWTSIRATYGAAGLAHNYIETLDVNGDGLPDRVSRAYNSPYNHWKVQLNNGNGFNPPARWEGVSDLGLGMDWTSPRAWTTASDSYTYVENLDINGDGLPDRVMRATGSPFNHFEVQLNSDFLPDLLVKVDNGLGGKIEVAYKSSTQFSNTGQDTKPDLPFPVAVVSSIKSSDGQGNTYTTTYEYRNGLYDWQDREFRGFGYVKVIDAEGSYSETYFKQDDIYKGRPYLQQAKDSAGNLYTKAETTWNYNQPYAGVYFPYISQTDNYIYDGDATYKQTRARFEYDTYGNPAKTISEGEVGVTGDEKTQVIEYVYNTSKWFLAFPKHSYLLNAQGVKISEKWFYYDNAVSVETLPASGLLTKEEALVTNPITLQSSKSATQLSYDAYGNLKSATDALARVTTTIYETDLNTYPIKVINALGHVVQSTYDYKTGQVLTSTDPNNRVTRNIYDCLGRPIKLIGPNDTESYPAVSYEYQLGTFPIKITTRTKADYASPPNYLTSYEFSDGLGRLIQSKSPAEPNPQTNAQRQIVSGVTVYDSRGQVKEQYLPYFAAVSAEYAAANYATPHASFTYDSMARLIKQTNPDATYSTVSYSDWKKTTTDENGHTRAEYYDAYGQIIKIEEYNQGQVYTTTYTYDTLGNLVKVTDNQNNISQIWYDSLGRKIKMDDPDMGIWAYEYDAVGNLVKQTDAKAQVLSFDYDALNRLTRKYTSAQTRATYLYDDISKGNCIGRLSKITDLSGSTEFFYDNLGREIKSIKTVSGSSSYAVERTYDALDRLLTLKYPDGEILTYTYNPQGIEKVQGVALYITNIDYLPTGQMAKVNYANGVVTDYTYDSNTLRLKNLVSQSAKGRIQDLSYQFDSVGNIKQIGDYVNTATQNFIYDDLDRLIQANGAYGAFSYVYDSIGNMLSKEGVSLTYGKNGKLPHAVTQYGATTLSYDANGNMITGKGKTLTYDVENRLLSVNQSGTISSFVYDGDGGRVKKTNGANSTVYIGSLFEKDASGKTTKYIFAGANRIASKESTGNTYYYHSDHLGSSNVVTDASANQVGFTEFTPYGSTYRQTGTYDPKHKFTGKELDSTGLYFYGARYYDPEIGRFISADTIVQSPYNPQTFNRYSYCNNNPINYVDPTGHSWFNKWWGKIVGVIAGIVGTILTGNIMVGFQIFNLFSSLQSTISTGNWGAFAGGLAGGLIGGYVGGALAGQVAGALGKSAFTFGGGFLIGATEMGVAGFGGSFGGALGGGASFGEAMKQGAIGLGIGAAVGGLVEGSYLSGMQNIAHGQSRRDIYEAGIKRLNALSVKNTDKTTAIVGSRPLGEPSSSAIGRHRYIRGRAGWFEMGPDETTGLIEINGENSLGGTVKYVNRYKSQLLETTVTVSQSGFNKAINYYNAAWVKIPTQYSWKSYNSNYAANSVIYGAGANVPENLGYTPGFPDKVK